MKLIHHNSNIRILFSILYLLAAILLSLHPGCAVRERMGGDEITNPETPPPGLEPETIFIVFQQTMDDGTEQILGLTTRGNLQQLTALSGNCFQPRWGRDGKTIYFILKQGGFGTLYGLSLQSGRLTNITGNDFNVQTYSISFTGELISFIYNDEDGNPRLMLYELSGKRFFNIFSGQVSPLSTPAWAIKDKRIAFVSEQDGLYRLLMMTPDGQQTDVIYQSNGAPIRVGNFSNNWRYLSFEVNQNLFKWDRDDSTVSALLPSTGISRDPIFSHSGYNFTFYTYLNGYWLLFLGQVDGTSQPLTDFQNANFLASAWFHKSPAVAFITDQTGAPEIFQINQDGSELKQLTFNRRPKSDLDVSPNH